LVAFTWTFVVAGIVGIGWSVMALLEATKYTDDQVATPPNWDTTRREFTADQVEQAATLFAGSLVLFAIAVFVYWVNQRLDNKAPW
jgi:hypothetical protein